MPDPAAATREPADLYVAERLLAHAREDLARADSKAAVLLSGAAFALPALLLGGAWQPAPPVTGAPWALLVSGGLLWAVGTALLVRVVLPRTGTSRTGPGMTFFADALAPPDIGGIVQAVRAAAEDRVSWLAVQLVDISRILVAKYRCLRVGTCCLVTGLALGGTGALLR
ncbi:Pycsar system effector family protein [Streptomyces sp. NPDC048171]|uniref:Pycsar system effector family protein n=1 Tax=unclassified Streptomyces TaxID=2593676 RepID=UPI001F390BF9|nr:Pycsar system effector family protein [Streptomyces sp. SID5789]